MHQASCEPNFTFLEPIQSPINAVLGVAEIVDVLDELASLFLILFDSKVHMHKAKTKSNLKNSLKVEISSRPAEKWDIDVAFHAGCAILRVVSWPAKGTVQDYLDRFHGYLRSHLRKGDVYLIFDR